MADNLHIDFLYCLTIIIYYVWDCEGNLQQFQNFLQKYWIVQLLLRMSGIVEVNYLHFR